MIADYALDSTLYEQCMTLLDACFPGVKAMADEGRTYNAFWDKSSIPFIIRQEQEIIAHLGLLPFSFIIQGKSFQAAAMHGICTKKEFRKKGYFKELMTQALKFTQEKYDFSFLFTDQPYLYEKFGFRVLAEYDFVYHFSSKEQTGKKSKIREISLANPDDLRLMHSLCFNRIPISNCFGIIKETTVTTLNVLHLPIYYIEAIDGLLIYQIINDVLYIKDIITTKICDFELVLNAIVHKFSKVILQFSPDSFLKMPFDAITATPECCLMISENFDIKCPSFRYPELQRC
ncbi:MAG: GNAT family N-acetyltransferase [Proteobacteria bacterium]|nr:GNAT family N-acetyltransferase [Pseudomonadota bacterium]